jgi:3-deoxy-manno-octulosonate cytidylyltransferase (CMP-KDO synthetase)
MTANTHMNGTNRCAEAAETLDCTHILLLQGDEPLLLPRHISAMIAAMRANPEGDAWNATAPINDADELDRHSFVKCALGVQERINFCFRRSPSIAPFDAQQTAIRKILGMIGFRRDYLMKIAGQPATTFEKTESIEQMRIVETGGFLTSVPVDESLPSVNEPAEAQHVLDYLQKSEEQAQLLRRVLAW